MKRANILKNGIIFSIMLIVCCLAVGRAHAATAETAYTPKMTDYCAQPPFLSGYVPPQVLFTMGKDHKYYLAAYNDSSDIDADGVLDLSYKHSFDYYGYFDSNKCYSYASGVFTPFGITSNKYCEATNCTDSNGTAVSCANKFSGNFLNWAAMSRADVVKMVIYGGFRTSDNNGTNYAELSGESIPQDGHIWGKEYLGADSAKLFPGGVANRRALFCVNGTNANGKNISQLKILPDVTAVTTTVFGGLRAWHWINVNGNNDICADGKIDTDGNGTADTVTLTNRTNYNVSVKVCDPADGYNYVGDWEKKHCKNYSTTTPQDANGPWRPVGLMQIYGETPNSVKVCSKDMATACNNDGDCSGNGQCVNASNMFFGLMMGSYTNPKAGGGLRKSVYSINEETNQSNGILQTSASSGKGLLMKSIEELKAPVSYPLSTHTGNPIAEIMYEGLRYWAGKTTPTNAFVSGISNGANGDNNNYYSQGAWDQPATLYPSCSMPFNLVFSDTYNSYDHDQLPGSSFATFTGDLTGMNVTTLANQISANETLGTNLIVGELAGGTGDNIDGACGGKTLSSGVGLGNVKGLCPEEGNQSGSYYAGAVALYGRNYMKAQMNTPPVLTYVVAFPSDVPNLTFYTSSGRRTFVSPYGKSVSNTSPWACTTSNTTFPVTSVTTAAGSTVNNLKFTPGTGSNCPTLSTVSFYLEATEYDGSNRLKYAKYVVATDDLGGGDYDLDMLVRYTVCAGGATNAACSGVGAEQVKVTTERVSSSAGNIAAFGFTISNVGTDSKTYLVLEHARQSDGTYPSNMGDNPGDPLWNTHLPNSSVSILFNVAASGAELPKPPLWYAAKYGGYKGTASLPYTDNTCLLPLTNASRNPRCNEWSSKIPGVPDTYFEVSNPSQMETRLRDALEDILGRVASGTAASILNNSEGSGASLLQAVFYPKKDFDGSTSVNWIGEMHNMWYYLDPFLQSTTIREDSNQDFKLNLQQDKIAQFFFDSGESKTKVRLFSDLNGDGVPDSVTPDTTIDADQVKSLWKAGRKLWQRRLSTDPRLIYTHTDIAALEDSTTKLTPFGVNPDRTSNNVADLTGNATFLSILQTTDTTKAAKLISYTHGSDQAPDADGKRYRSRSVLISACANSGSGCETTDSIYTRPWKLGDIISSTPKLVSNVPQNSYSKPSPLGYGDKSYEAFTKTSTYANRGMVFVGSNSGMLHAFKLGTLKENSGKYDKAQFNDPGGNLADANDDLGREEWAFIPKQVLPYLTYNKDVDYCHIYTVDKTSTIVDVAVGKPTECLSANYWDCSKMANGSTWKSILIGGMGTGGAVKWNGNGNYVGGNGTAVKTPVKNPTGIAVPGVNPEVEGIGYSSYFALDVTDPTTPKYLWEFPSKVVDTSASPIPTPAFEQLGYTTTGPAVVRIAARTGSNADNSKNGRWFAVFASGPTGPIDIVKREFKGESDQQLKLFVVDMADGKLVRTITEYRNSDNQMVNLPNLAYGSSLSSAVIDTDRATLSADGWYSDDAVYIGFVKKDTANNTWTKGGVIRLLTRESTDPANWEASMVIDNIGPVTSSVTKLQDRKNKNFWLFIGTGRFTKKNDDTTGQQALYGVKEPCYSTKTRASRTTHPNLVPGTDNQMDTNCYNAVTDNSAVIVNQSGSLSTAPQTSLAETDAGWYINLDASGTPPGSFAERIITDPVASPAGAVFFTSFKPSNDMCKFGGDSLIWAVNYQTGGVPAARAMLGKALMQVSTGAFAEINLSSAFVHTDNARLDGRRLATPISGVPPTSQGLSLLSNPPPVKKYLHVREK